jgi:hypothetical protein
MGTGLTDANIHIKIPVFANTGCHLHFEPVVSLDESVTPREEDRIRMEKNLASIAEGGRAVFRGAVKKRGEHDNEEWSSFPDKPWLRFRFGSKYFYPEKGDKFPVAGLWLAVETNTGDHLRGVKTTTLPASPEERAKYSGISAGGLPSPYRHKTAEEIPVPSSNTEPAPDSHMFEIELASADDNGFGVAGTLHLDLIWKKASVKEPIDVELVIDFGNTRTAALRLERNRDETINPDEFSAACKKVLLRNTFYDSSEKLERESACWDAITDSWFILKEPLFSNFADEMETPEFAERIQNGIMGIGKKRITVCERIHKRLPQMFVRLSPAVFGEEAAGEIHDPYTRLMMTKGGRILQSSPKRYYWDRRPPNNMWNMTLRRSNKMRLGDPRIEHGLPELTAAVLRLMPSDDSEWTAGNPPTSWPGQRQPMSPRRKDDPNDPRCATMTWLLTAILECAWSQMNSGMDPDMPFAPRRLRRVVATFPSGWSKTELDLYKRRWREAVNIFHLTNNPPDIEPPGLSLELDEAVASQLPVIFSGVQQMGGGGGNYFKLMGRAGGRLRAMNVDIGGGTTDIAVIEYHDSAEGGNVNLSAGLLFKTSFTKAGDELVKEIISRVLIPVLCDFTPNPHFQRKMTKPATDAEESVRASHTRMVLIPLATRFLTETGAGSARAFSPAGAGVDARIWRDFLEWAGLPVTMPADAKLPADYTWIKKIITELFMDIARSVAMFTAAFDTDMLILSGKPSELPDVRALFEDTVPLPRHKILSSKGFRAEKWYPFAEDGHISDAKSVTVVGAALARALRGGMIRGWDFQFDQRPLQDSGNLWGTLDTRRRFLDIVLLEAKDSVSKPAGLQIGNLIGKAPEALRNFPEPVFRLAWKDPKEAGKAGLGNQLKGIVFRRLVSADGEPESIEVDPESKITDNAKHDISPGSLILTLCPTWEEGGFWMDTGLLNDIDWNFTKQG